MWYFKQLFPLSYNTEYMIGDKKIVSIWKMWFGRCYDIKEYEVK